MHSGRFYVWSSMRKNKIKPGFYWVNRQYTGMTIGLVKQACYHDGGYMYVMFPGTTACYQVGTPCPDNISRIEPRRFKSEVVPHSRNRL